MTPHQCAARPGHILGWLGMASGVIACAAMVFTASQAAFTGSATNQTNQYATGAVDLVDHLNNAAALFQVDNMRPGQSEARCIEVTYAGNIPDPGPVRFYSGGASDTGLGAHLTITVEEGAGGGQTECSGFDSEIEIVSGTLAAFNASQTSYSSGTGAWDPSSTPETRTYRITVGLASNAPNEAQGQSVTSQTFKWEVQS